MPIVGSINDFRGILLRLAAVWIPLYDSDPFQSSENDDGAFWADRNGIATRVSAESVQIEIPKIVPFCGSGRVRVGRMGCSHSEESFFCSEGDGGDIKLRSDGR